MNSENIAEKPVTVIIPAYNEEKTITDVVRGVQKYLPRADVLVINDGSTDSTALRAAEAGARVISHPLNKGNGASIKTALRAMDGGYAAILDADGQHDPADLPRLIGLLEEFDLVVGARVFNGANGSPLRNFGNSTLCKLATFLSEQKVPDLTSGLRAFRHEIVSKFINIYPNGYSFPSTSTLSLIVAGYNVKFEPISIRPRPVDTESKLSPFRDGFRFLMFILRVITLANPNKIFFPAGLLMVLFGIVITVRNLLLFSQFSSGAVLFLAGGINIIFFGLILDQFASLRLKEKE